VSKECLVPVLRELGLRLPTNIDLTDFTFYDPPLDYDVRVANSRAPRATVLHGKREGSKETTASPEETMGASYSRRDMEKEDGEVADVDELHPTSHSSRVSQTPALRRPTSRATSATTASSTEPTETENAGDDIPMPSQTGDIVEVSSGAPTPKGPQTILSQDDTHSVPDSIASSAKVSYSSGLVAFQLTVSTSGEHFRDDYSHALS
jgi:hypothetical protein